MIIIFFVSQIYVCRLQIYIVFMGKSLCSCLKIIDRSKKKKKKKKKKIKIAVFR